MDSEAQHLWTSKLARLRADRQSCFDPRRRPDLSFEDLGGRIDQAAREWAEIFSAWWRRECPDSPEPIAEAAKKEIRTLLEGERDNVIAEMDRVFAADKNRFFGSGKDAFLQACETCIGKCHEAIADLRSERRRQISKDEKANWYRWREILAVSMLSLIVGATTTYFSNWLATERTKNQVSQFRVEAEAVKSKAQSLEQRVLVLNKISPPFGLFDAEGNTVYQEERLKRYGVKVHAGQNPDYEPKDPRFGWFYTVEFAKPPKTLLVFSQVGDIVTKKMLSPTKYKLEFLSPGFGNPLVKSEFVLEVLEPSG